MVSSRTGSRQPPPSCDTMVALPEATRAGATIFAKNSDRPPGECQPLELVDRAVYPPGARLRCQYVEIPQARETARVLGSRPVWLWGFEHGLNEHGVAVGNETIFGRTAPAASGLLGMDLVRLALERSETAERALEVLIELIETHGQGGSGFREFEFPYDNSFLVADGREAWILEAVGRTWAARRCRAVDSITNQITIGADWDRLSADAVERARSLGLAVTDPFDFAAAYREREKIPAALSEGRLRRSRECLAAARGEVTPATMRELLRDHDRHGRRFVPGASPEDEQFYTICMHQGVSRTAASIVAELPSAPRSVVVARAAFGRPCTSVFFPVVLAGELPGALRRGSDEPSDALWWVFENLAATAERAEAAAARIRDTLDELEAELDRELDRALPALASIRSGGDEGAASDFMARIARRVDTVARELLAACAG